MNLSITPRTILSVAPPSSQRCAPGPRPDARRFLNRLHRDRRGLALTEFAFAAPLFLTLVLTGLELTNLALAHLRVSQMAMTVADNAGRVTAGIDEANIYEVFAGAEVIGNGLDFASNGRMVLSSLEDNGQSGAAAGQTITWQRCWGAGAFDPAYGLEGAGASDATLATGLGANGALITASPGTAVMFVEAEYDYQPLIGSGFFPAQTIRYESAFNVRGRQNNAISNTQALTVLDCPVQGTSSPAPSPTPTATPTTAPAPVSTPSPTPTTAPSPVATGGGRLRTMGGLFPF